MLAVLRQPNRDYPFNSCAILYNQLCYSNIQIIQMNTVIFIYLDCQLWDFDFPEYQFKEKSLVNLTILLYAVHQQIIERRAFNNQYYTKVMPPRKNSLQQATISQMKPHQQIKKRIAKQHLIKLSKKTLRKLARQRIMQRRIRSSSITKVIGPRQVVFSINQQQYNCPICLQMLLYSSSLQCGHTYCLPCLQNLSKANIKKQCSVCRAEDFIEFHEINRKVEQIVSFIHSLKLSQKQRQEYQSRKISYRLQFQCRGIKGTPKLNDFVRIKISNYWVKGKIIKITQKRNRIFYEIFAILSEERYFINKNSINIKQQKIQKVQKAVRQSNCIFSQNIFIQESVHTQGPNNTYNIQQLLWQVSYYEPQQVHNSSWSIQFSHRLIQQALQQRRIRNTSYEGIPVAEINDQTE